MRDVRVAGVIFNEVGGERHRAMLAQAAARADLPVLGYLPAFDDIALPSRHLGLVQAREHDSFDRYLDRLCAHFAPHLELDALRALAHAPMIAQIRSRRARCRRSASASRSRTTSRSASATPRRCSAGALRAQRSSASRRSPAEAPDPAADAIFLPGGYPELHAGRLAANGAFMDGLRQAARKGTAIYGECGGYMTLGEGLIDAEGERHAMAGLLPVVTSFAARKLHLGYRQGTLLADSPLGKAGGAFRGHEFHYATVVSEGRASRCSRSRMRPVAIWGGKVAGRAVCSGRSCTLSMKPDFRAFGRR